MKTSKILIFMISLVFLTVSAGLACPVSDQAATDSAPGADLAAAEFFYGISDGKNNVTADLNRSPAAGQEAIQNALSSLVPADFYGYNQVNTHREFDGRAVAGSLAESDNEREASSVARISASEFFYGYPLQGREAGQCINC